MQRLLTIGLLAVLLSTPQVGAETEPTSDEGVVYSYSKGQVLDFLFLETKPDSEAKLKDYFGTVFPLVQEAGYRPLPGFKISSSPTQGNYHPSTLAIATWNDQAARSTAMARIEAAVPDFHQRRRDIWSSFAMTVYSMEDDVSFTASRDRLYVLTTYWAEEPTAFDAFERRWLEEASAKGGAVKLRLGQGVSPFGYRYAPDHLTITEWPSREAFDAFYQANLAMDHRGVEHVNQFILDLPQR